jgi:ribonuclease H2 subunit A
LNNKIFVDTVGPPEKYQEKLSMLFPGIEIVVTKKADSLFPIVSCASICAKVTRDETMIHWKYIEPISFENNFGSGYPSDPNTVSWLKTNYDVVFGYPRCIRFSWSTCDTLLNSLCKQVEWEKQESNNRIFEKKRDILYRNMGLQNVSSF